MTDISYNAYLTFFLSGNGDKYLADDGTYKAVNIPAATTTTIGGITEPDDTKYFGDTFVAGVNGTVLSNPRQKRGCPFTLQWNGDDGIRTATYWADYSGSNNNLNLADDLVAHGSHECSKYVSTVTADLDANKFCIEYPEFAGDGSTPTRKFIYEQNSPFQQAESINSSALTACLAGTNNGLWFYTLTGGSSIHIYKFNGQDTTINVMPYSAVIGSIPICFDHNNGLCLAIDFNASETTYTLVSYKASNNTKTTIADITNYMSQAGNVFPVNLFFSNGSLYVLTTFGLTTFGVMRFQYSGSSVTYQGYTPLGTTNSDPVSVVQINFIKNAYWMDTALLYYRKSANKWFYWYGNNKDAIENMIMQEDGFCM